MNRILYFICLISFFATAKAQKLRFEFADSTMLPAKPLGQLHGVSGIDYVRDKDQWHWATDRGAYFVFDGVKNIRDFAKLETTAIPKVTWYWFESVRFDQHTGKFFYAVEYEYEPQWNCPDTTTYVAMADSFPPLKPRPDYLVPPLALPADNKGIESVAVTEKGDVWVAPEAGWAGETEVGQDTIHFLKFIKTTSGYAPGGQYSYVIDRSGCPVSQTEKRGGISEILANGENDLLVLERCYDQGKGRSKEIKAKLWHVTVRGNHLQKEPEPAFDFNKSMSFLPDNLEALSWWKTVNGKRQLVVASDDNPGLDNKQRTQVILLQEK